ncbi:GDSL esterase/lipase At1g28570-like [Typha angustifolia]|uniref:GDSL esterase/lipase At1g28570-like n=1 Tax=Typha angustifolia TaxID=59011 RepID=UPI003C2F59C0
MEQLLSLILVVFLSTHFCIANSSYNAIFSFGNSFTDTGNIAVLAQSLGLSSIAMNFLPYGMTFFGHPTGRSSDGRLVIDFIAEEFGLPMVPPYLAHSNNYQQGANFAVVGATALDPEFYQENNMTSIRPLNVSLRVQLGWFDELKPSLCKTAEDCRDYFGQSLFFVGEIGGNDHIYMLNTGISVEEVASYVPKMIETISMAIERLIKEGVITLVVPGIMPSGCVPAILTLFQSQNKEDYDPRTGCLKKYNILSRYHDVLLRNAVVRLSVKYPQARIIFAEYVRPVIQFARSPAKYGFTGGALRACCGEGGPYNFNFSALCGVSNVTACNNPSTYVSWDGVHMTEAAYKYIAGGWLRGPYADPPISSVLPNGFPHGVTAKK